MQIARTIAVQRYAPLGSRLIVVNTQSDNHELRGDDAMFGKREMLSPASVAGSQPPAAGPERRRYPRLPLDDLGRYLLASGQEFACRARDVSLVGLALSGPLAGRSGERVVAYLDRLGRVEGVLMRVTRSMFAIQFAGGEARQRRLRRRLVDIFQDEMAIFTGEARSASDPTAPRVVVVRAPCGDLCGELIAISFEAAEVAMEGPPAVGSPVRLLGRLGFVARQQPGEVLIEFDLSQAHATAAA